MIVKSLLSVQIGNKMCMKEYETANSSVVHFFFQSASCDPIFQVFGTIKKNVNVHCLRVTVRTKRLQQLKNCFPLCSSRFLYNFELINLTYKIHLISKPYHFFSSN